MSPEGPFTPTLVSVVMPVRNAAREIEAQLAALEAQRYEGAWEVVVADNGSTDGTLAMLERWHGRLPGLRVVDASDRIGAAGARNAGAAAARGDLLVFCDADDVVAEGWLVALVRAAADAPLVGGSIDPRRINPARLLVWRPAVAAEQLAVSGDYLPYAWTANLAIHADVFAAVGGFRTDFDVGEDVELSWRVQLAGHRLAFAGDAVVDYRYRDGLRALVRQYVAYGGIGPHLYSLYRDAGMPPSPAGPALRQWASLLVRLVLAVRSPERFGDVARRIAFRWGRVRGSLRHRVVYL